MRGYTTGSAGIVIELEFNPAKKRHDGLPGIKVIGFFETGKETHQYLEEKGFSPRDNSIMPAWVNKQGVYALEATMYVERPFRR